MEIKQNYFGEKITKLAHKLEESILQKLEIEKLSEDRNYIIKIQEDFLKPLVVKEASFYDDEDIINQIYFQISPEITPQLSPAEFCAGVCIENIGKWKIREHNLTHIKDIIEENSFFKWWYFECIRMGVPGWTRVYYDQYLAKNVVTYSTPIYMGNKQLLGVLGIDLDYNYFTEKINQRLVENIKKDIEKVNNERASIGDHNALDHQYLDINTYKFINNNNITSSLGQNSPAMTEVQELIKKAIISDATILLQGETGVGKDYISNNIHTNSKFSAGPFINVNCCALSENLIESELFGYGKGSFTGAKSDGKAGFFEAANNGTLLLNEIGDLPIHLQAKLLNVIHDKEVIRVGETKKRKTNFRLIAATNKNLYKLVSEGKFREDLYYRINVLPIFIPPLRERKEDIYPLFQSFLSDYCIKYHTKKEILTEVLNVLIQYSWPGNVRELENLTERLVITSSKKYITCDDLPQNILQEIKKNTIPKKAVTDELIVEKEPSSKTLKEQLEAFERKLIQEKYEQLGSSYKVAQNLGISQSAAYKKIKKYILK